MAALRLYETGGPGYVVLLVVGVLVFVVAAPWVLPRFWRDPASIPVARHPFATRAGLERARKAYRRSAAVTFMALSSGTVGLVAEALSSRLPAFRLVDAVASAIGLTCVVLVVTVRLFNWPKAVVPPSLRSDLGTVADRRIARRRRRARS